MPDIIIPLGPGSKFNNDELRISLRSVEKNLDVDKVYVATTIDIPWLKNAIKVPVDDPWDNNKDKNLIYKVVKTLEMYPEIDKFYFWSDDFVILQPIGSNHINIYNDRSLDYFKANPPTTKWQKRLANTLNILKVYGYDASVNWDSHTPLLLSSKDIVSRATLFEYDSFAANYTVCTLLAFINGLTRKDGVHQDLVKVSYESEFKGEIDTRFKYLGHNDLAFSTGLREKLFELFPECSKYEGIEANDSYGVAFLVKNLKNIDILTKIIKNTSLKPFIFPLDSQSAETIATATINATILNTFTDTIPESIRISTTAATALAKYSVIIDGNTDYTTTYIKDSIDEVTNASMFIDDADHNKVLLLNEAVKDVATNTVSTYEEYINKLKSIVKPIIIVNN